jgi:hypothetical protein
MLEKFIAEDGHVVQVKVTAHVDPVGLLAKPERVGINKATTFAGFCSKHDNDLFSPLESSAFDFESRQIALLAYRAVCRELYAKDAEIAAADALRNYVSVNPDIPGFTEKDSRHQIMRLARINARTNLADAKDRFAAMLSDQKLLRYYGVKFEDSPVYLNSVAFLPEWDFDGTRLQDLSFIAEFKPICFSAWAAGNHAAAVFSWHASADDMCIPFVSSLRRCKSDRLANRLLSMAFEVSDNVVFQRDWWESLRERDRQRLVARAFSGVGDVQRKADCLMDDYSEALTSEVVQEYVRYGDGELSKTPIDSK